ncbi:multifunctional acyl-CoA thioesterase I/protease I/lysophospholipase L1 [Arenicella chitinivorans]|uniref:Multifunctional acyl-CoA thioesterase I/protease I/lysophospholipase L1 n=1 Tax=Arenicella chitinivorans TaxID=1329800 RepID=A0A918RZW3_9GAMM|nr:GDSL-type esterase/lipase family protein [Arenicella chitinivorans]GHA17908.1 multifunctional acyl-CoA thioesterase I/protease I/lysophospholipase L1 [Arenicella chitinivorans]
MHRKFLQLSSQLTVFLLLIACGGGGSDSGGGQAPPPPAPKTTVVAIGDSIGNGFDIATPWPSILGGKIDREVINMSVTNERTGFGVTVIDQLIDQHNPSHVFILLGTNDALRNESLSGAVNNLQTMVNIARSRDVIPIVGTIPPLTIGVQENRNTDVINRGIRQLSNAVIAPVRSAIGNGSTIVDGVHPNQEGQELIADAFASVYP